MNPAVAVAIEDALARGMEARHFELQDESHRHGVPPGAQSHFRLVVVADEFHGLGPVARHRRIYRLLDELLKGPIHALALHTYSSEEWRRRGATAPLSPPCLGGSAGLEPGT